MDEDEIFKDAIKTSSTRRKKGTGTIQKKGKKWLALAPRNKVNANDRGKLDLGKFDTYEEAEKVLDKYLIDNDLVKGLEKVSI